MAAELIGCSKWRIILKHMGPNFSQSYYCHWNAFDSGNDRQRDIIEFLGLGLRPPAISYGVMLQEAQNVQTMANAPWLMLPGLVLVIAVLMFNLIGDGLRDAADPYSK